MKKHNRKLVAAICLLIAFKCTAFGGYELNEDRFHRLKNDIKILIGDQGGQHSKKKKKVSTGEGYNFLHRSLKHYELRILSALNFQTEVPLAFIVPHMEAILNHIDVNLQDYLGEEAYNDFIAQRGLEWSMNGITRYRFEKGAGAAGGV